MPMTRTERLLGVLGLVSLVACTSDRGPTTVNPTEANTGGPQTQDHFIVEGLNLLSPDAFEIQVNNALEKNGIMAKISLVAPADALAVTTAKDNEGGVVSQVGAVVTNSDGKQNNTLLVCQEGTEENTQSCSFFNFSNSSTSPVIENEDDGSMTQTIFLPLWPISKDGVVPPESPYDVNDKFGVTFSTNPSDGAINPGGAKSVEIMKDGVFTQAKVQQGGDLANWWKNFLLASLKTSQNVSLPVAGEILPTETIIPTPTFTPEPTYTSTSEPTPTVEPTKVLIDEHDMEIHYEDRMENQEFMGVKFNGSVIVDKSMSRQIDKVTIEDNVHAEFLARTIFGVWWDKGNVDHEGLPTEDDFKAFMAQWAKAQQTNDPKDWEAVQFTIWANNLEDGDGYVQEPTLVWPMVGEETTVSEGVLGMKEFNNVLVGNNRRIKNISDWGNTLGTSMGTNFDTSKLYIYFRGTQVSPGSIASALSATRWWLKLNNGKDYHGFGVEDKSLLNLLKKVIKIIP